MNNPVMKQLTPEYKALAIHFDLPFSYIKAYAESLNSIPAGWFLSWFSMVCEPNCEIALSDNQVFDETGLSKRRWYYVRKILLDKKVIVNRREFGKSLYRLHEDNIELLLRKSQSAFIAPINVNRAHMSCLLRLGLTLKAVILNAYIIDCNPARDLSERCDDGVPILLIDEDIYRDTFLSSSQINTSLNELKKLGIISIVHQNQQRYALVHYQKLGELTYQFIENESGDYNE